MNMVINVILNKLVPSTLYYQFNKVSFWNTTSIIFASYKFTMVEWFCSLTLCYNNFRTNFIDFLEMPKFNVNTKRS